MWLAEVKAKAKRKNQILFSKDSLLLTDLRHLIGQANRRALILWALKLAEETARELAEKYPEDHRPLEAIPASRAWIGRLQRICGAARNVLRTAASLLDGIRKDLPTELGRLSEEMTIAPSQQVGGGDFVLIG